MKCPWLSKAVWVLHCTVLEIAPPNVWPVGIKACNFILVNAGMGNKGFSFFFRILHAWRLNHIPLSFFLNVNDLNLLQFSSCLGFVVFFFSFLFPLDLFLGSSSLHSAWGKTEHNISAAALLKLSGVGEAVHVLQALFLTVRLSMMFVFFTTTWCCWLMFQLE